MIDIGGSDQCKVVFLRDRKDNPTVRLLEDIGLVVVE